jgi:3-hexulose-6-phosphate synthase
MALIQVALDTLRYEDTLALADKLQPYVDIIEIGTPSVKYAGIRIVEAVRAYAPNRKVLADLKTMDAGLYEASPFFKVGADIVTVLGAADVGTISGVIEAAKLREGGMAQVDLISVPNKMEKAFQVAELGAHIIGVHTGLDAQARGQTPFEDLKAIVGLSLPVMVSVAGGINKDTVRQVIDAGADIVVVGAAIYGAADPVRAAAEIREAVERG